VFTVAFLVDYLLFLVGLYFKHNSDNKVQFIAKYYSISPRVTI